jgi:hypothetical protein
MNQPPFYRLGMGTARMKGASRHCHRSPHTFQEIKALADGGNRGKRSKKYLPDSYDDLNVSSREDRSWKNFRKTQYKVRDAG